MLAEIEFYQLTSIGNREVNQDCMAHRVCNEYALFVVADGLGGHHGGEKASQYFCRCLIALVDKYRSPIQSRGAPAVQDWIAEAVVGMRELFAGDPVALNAHTTCAILYLDAEQVITAHCGDSRIYRLNAERVLWRTKDHSLPQQLFDEGKISEWEMGVHPDQHKLTRSINALYPPVVDIVSCPPVKSGETFILCSDGFWEFVKEPELLQLSQPASAKPELQKMAKMAVLRAQGKSDNVTVQWVRKR
ncbi:serine/threonine-protein phosphatase [Methylomonas sp. EFPC3]|uniref:PP2C family protein-serine/threonine phosphatase n=1 Tax=Methylomonas sp. EFPC3 TaxID=3021710 RepID=UPI00241652E7|nr:PP2C family serine/threonine-protein phosphatase [Methylomonas sp. EFPC3]WFP52021.1 serine/threonine-protein phosphatase [Methylomonas sp. EFPC3]